MIGETTHSLIEPRKGTNVGSVGCGGYKTTTILGRRTSSEKIFFFFFFRSSGGHIYSWFKIESWSSETKVKDFYDIFISFYDSYCKVLEWWDCFNKRKRSCRSEGDFF